MPLIHDYKNGAPKNNQTPTRGQTIFNCILGLVVVGWMLSIFGTMVVQSHYRGLARESGYSSYEGKYYYNLSDYYGDLGMSVLGWTIGLILGALALVLIIGLIQALASKPTKNT